MSLKRTVDGHWVPVGEWFERLVELPRALIEFEAKNQVQLKRTLLAVPSRSLVVNAIAWGYSKLAFDNPKPAAQSYPISELQGIATGTKVRFIFPVGRGVKSRNTIAGGTSRQTSVGFFKGAVQERSLLKTSFEVNGVTTSIGLAPGVRFSLEEDVTPEGIYWEPVYAGKDEKALRRNYFNSQQNPQSLIFTEEIAFKEELAFQFQEASLFEALGVSSLSFEEATRLDQLTHDKHSHFINTWENYKDFDNAERELDQRLQAYKLVILDGNVAVDHLAQKDALRNIPLLGIFETGRNKIQDRGSAAFLGEAMYSKPIQDFETLLSWKSPDGIKIWGWS